jgi:hypothetical protein
MLFLHGMFLPPSIYQDKIATPLLSCLEDHRWECVFLNSPRPNSGPVFEACLQLFPELTEHPEWMNSCKEGALDGATKLFDSFQGSLKILQDYLSDNPKFDVIAGHSQGALMAPSILSLFTLQCYQGEWLGIQGQQ